MREGTRGSRDSLPVFPLPSVCTSQVGFLKRDLSGLFSQRFRYAAVLSNLYVRLATLFLTVVVQFLQVCSLCSCNQLAAMDVLLISGMVQHAIFGLCSDVVSRALICYFAGWLWSAARGGASLQGRRGITNE
jgi:hypothetical protein